MHPLLSVPSGRVPDAVCSAPPPLPVTLFIREGQGSSMGPMKLRAILPCGYAYSAGCTHVSSFFVLSIQQGIHPWKSPVHGSPFLDLANSP